MPFVRNHNFASLTVVFLGWKNSLSTWIYSGVNFGCETNGLRPANLVPSKAAFSSAANAEYSFSIWVMLKSVAKHLQTNITIEMQTITVFLFISSFWSNVHRHRRRACEPYGARCCSPFHNPLQSIPSHKTNVAATVKYCKTIISTVTVKPQKLLRRQSPTKKTPNIAEAQASGCIFCPATGGSQISQK